MKFSITDFFSKCDQHLKVDHYSRKNFKTIIDRVLYLFSIFLWTEQGNIFMAAACFFPYLAQIRKYTEVIKSRILVYFIHEVLSYKISLTETTANAITFSRQ